MSSPDNKKNTFKPTPVRLGELKAPLQEAASSQDRSLNWLIISILKRDKIIIDFFKSKK